VSSLWLVFMAVGPVGRLPKERQSTVTVCWMEPDISM